MASVQAADISILVFYYNLPSHKGPTVENRGCFCVGCIFTTVSYRPSSKMVSVLLGLKHSNVHFFPHEYYQCSLLKGAIFNLPHMINKLLLLQTVSVDGIGTYSAGMFFMPCHLARCKGKIWGIRRREGDIWKKMCGSRECRVQVFFSRICKNNGIIVG